MIQDATFWHVHATYSHSEHNVTIGGSETIPEFSVTTPILLVLLVSAAFILAKAGKGVVELRWRR